MPIGACPHNGSPGSQRSRFMSRLGLLGAMAMLFAVAGCASAAAPDRPGGTGAESALIGTHWQLASYQNPGAAGPVAVKGDSTIDFTGKGSFAARACNYISGDAKIDGHHIAFTQGISTTMGCLGEESVLEQQFTATTKGSVTWSVSGASS